MDLTSKSETVNSHVNSCVVNAHSVTGLPQKKGLIPNYCQNYTNNICQRCFLCRSLEFCKSCHKCPNCCSRSTCRGQTTPVLEKMGSPGASPKVITVLREGYTLPFRFRPNLTRSPTVISNYVIPHKNLHLLEALHQLVKKNTVEPVANQKSLGFYNRLFLVPKPNHRWRHILDLSTLDTFLNTELFKMETPETPEPPYR